MAKLVYHTYFWHHGEQYVTYTPKRFVRVHIRTDSCIETSDRRLLRFTSPCAKFVAIHTPMKMSYATNAY
jgi:hypothetical protein